MKGQDHVVLTLKNALQSGKVAHAFLFTGPRGVGKTTCARILARVLNCENPTSDWEPCNRCRSCISSIENASFNIFELDAASNNSVEDIRELVDQVRFQPQAGKFKIYIVDEVHMLSTAAFNAFLKTLEEPPPYAKFILATTEKHKIIPTILSRCQVYDFRRLRQSDMVKQLQLICEQEQIAAEPEALHLIAQKAEGAMRDALSTFDRITSFTGRRLSYQDVVENLHILDYDYYFKLTDAFVSEDVKEALMLVNTIVQMGFDVGTFLEGLATHLRNLLICKNPEMQVIFEGSEGMKQRYVQQADLCTMSFLLRGLDMINEAEVNLPRAKNQRLHIEILIAKLCFIKRKVYEDGGTAPTSGLAAAEKKNAEPHSINLQLPLDESSLHFAPAEASRASEPTANKITRPQTIHDASSGMANLITIPKLQSLDVLKNKVVADEQQKKKNLVEFNEATARQFWEKCVGEIKSNSLKAFVQSAQLDISENQLVIKVGSTIAREAIKQEMHLDDKVSNYFYNRDLRILIELDPEMEEQQDKAKPPKALSAREKWDLMVACNPHLAQFREKLHLKFDED